MFIAIISTLFNSMAVLFWKKALSYKAPNEFFTLLSHSSIILITISLYFAGYMDFSHLSFNYIIIILVMVIMGLLRTIITQKAYTVDKISVLMPYENINKILTIVLGFFIFGDISTISLLITLFAVIIIILFSIDLKTLKIPKSLKIFSFAQLITSILTLLLGYLLIEISEAAFFIISYIAGIFFISTIIFRKKEYTKIKKLPKQFFGYRIMAAHLGGFSYLLSIIVIKNLGVSTAILLSFLGIGITLIFSYIFLGDNPSRKNLILTGIVSILVGLGYYFK